MKKVKVFLLTGLLSTCFLAGCGDNGGEPTKPIIPVEAVIDHIDVTKMPTKTQYEELEVFDPTGMEVTAYYDDGTTRVLDSADYIVRPSGPLSATNTFVTIIEKESDQDRPIQITVRPGAEVTTEPQLWIEAEKGNMTFASASLNCASAFEYKESASGGAILKNFGKTGNKLTMKVNATAKGRTKMLVKLCKRPKNVTSFANMYSVVVNGITYPFDGTLEAGADGDYFDLCQISGYILLNEGLNEVSVVALNDTGSNLDAFGFASDIATITDGGTIATINHKDNGGYVKLKPTPETTGLYANGCQICGHGNTVENGVLPVLNERDYELGDGGIYTIHTKEGYTFVFGSSYRFECEDMALAGTVNAGPNKGKPACAEYNVTNQGLSPEGNAKCVYYMNNEGNTLTLEINSTRADKATVEVNVAARQNSKGVGFTVPFDEMYEFKANGVVLENHVNVVPNSGDKQPLDTPFEWHLITLGDIDLVEGKNTIVLTVVRRKDDAGTLSAGNLDYVEFTTTGARLTKAE